MKQKTILDYYDLIYKEYPNIPKSDIKRILLYGWKLFYLHNSYGADVLLNRNKFWLYCGRLSKDSLKHFEYYKKKLKTKLRILYKRNKIIWDGYYYFAISENQYKLYKELKCKKGRPRRYYTFKNIVLRRIYEECLVVDSGFTAIFRVPYALNIGYDRFYESFKTDEAELVLEKAPSKMKDILTSNYLYEVFKNKKYKL